MNGDFSILGMTDAAGAASLGAAVAMLAISLAALRSVVHLLVRGGDSARMRCRRWAIVATAVTIAWYKLATRAPIDPAIPIAIAIAAADCWLALWASPRLAIPRATVRSRARPA